MWWQIKIQVINQRSPYPKKVALSLSSSREKTVNNCYQWLSVPHSLDSNLTNVSLHLKTKCFKFKQLILSRKYLVHQSGTNVVLTRTNPLLAIYTGQIMSPQISLKFLFCVWCSANVLLLNCITKHTNWHVIVHIESLL